MERYSKVSFMSKSANDINEVSLGQESPMTLATGHEPQSHRSIDMLLKDTSRVIRKNSLEPLEKQNSQSSISSSKSTSSKLSGSDLSVKLTGKCPPTEREINKPVSLRLDANEIVSKIKGGGGAIAANKNLHVFPVDDEEDESSRSRSYMVGGRISSVFKNVFQASTAIEMAGPVAEKGHLVEIGSRKLLIWSDTDVELFYSIYDWKQRNPSARKRQCQSLFTNLHSASDAIIDFVFRESKFDYILKYDSNNPHQNIRDTYEKAVLELGCFLEIEMSREVNNEFFIKVITPFRVLCRAAENYKLRRPLKVRKRETDA